MIVFDIWIFQCLNFSPIVISRCIDVFYQSGADTRTVHRFNPTLGLATARPRFVLVTHPQIIP